MLKRLWATVRGHVEAYTGPSDARKAHMEMRQQVPSVPLVIKELASRWPDESADSGRDDPIFLLSAGWRSGSTLLQRLAASSREALIWGEPFALCELMQRLSGSLPAMHLVPDLFFLDNWPAETRFQDRFIANSYPNGQYLRRAHREFFNTLFALPARDAGFARWGIKEVRLGADQAHYLRWLFPAARIVLLYRNPYDCYRSYREFRDWYYSWPDDPVMTPRRFGTIWTELVRGYLRAASDLCALVVKYEELLSDPTCLDTFSEHVGVAVDRKVLDKRLSGRVRGRVGRDVENVPNVELRILRDAVEPLAQQLGYEPGSPKEC